MNYKTYADLSRDINQNINKISTDVDLIVGIPRSGMIPAYMIGQKLSKPVCSLNEFLSGDFGKTTSMRIKQSDAIKNILFIDDSVNFGAQTKIIKEKVAAAGLDKKYNIKYAAIYYSTDESKSFVDIALARVLQPRLFQWNYLNHSILPETAWDIDGLLCVDPTDEENDDGENYVNFLQNAKPLHIPNYEIGALVTSRLEKYRPETEQWMRDNGVKYKKLYMLNVGTAEERRKLGLHAKFKSEIFSKLDAIVFYESDPVQAKNISLLSGKPCFCTATDELFVNGEIFGALPVQIKVMKNKSVLWRRLIAAAIPSRRLRRKIRRQ